MKRTQGRDERAGLHPGCQITAQKRFREMGPTYKELPLHTTRPKNRNAEASQGRITSRCSLGASCSLGACACGLAGEASFKRHAFPDGFAMAIRLSQ